MNISQYIKDLCIDKNINIMELSNLVKIDNSLLYKYINENTLPTVNNLVKIANFFDCTINYLVGLSDDPKQYKFFNTFDKSLFFPRYYDLLNKHNISHYSLSKKFKLAKSSFLAWKKGAIPNLDTLYKIAEYFSVSIDYLVGRSDIK